MSAFWRCTLTFFNTNLTLYSQNVIYMEDPSETLTAANVDAAIESNWWGFSGSNALRVMSSFHVRLQNASYQRIEPGPPLAGVPLPGNLISGAIGSGVTHPCVGFCFSLLDGLGGRRHRGRTYHCATASSSVTNGVPTSTTQAQWIAVRDNWLNSFGPLPTTGLHWNLFHRDLSGAARFTRIVDVRLNGFTRIQRRRNYGTGI